MHPAYQRLAQPEEPRHPARDIGVGLVLLLAIVLGFLFLPALPGEEEVPGGGVGSAPPTLTHPAGTAGETANLSKDDASAHP